MRKCLFCYKDLSDDEHDFHAACSKKIFGQPTPPELAYSEEDMLKLGELVVKNRTAIAGVQTKLSLAIDKISKRSEPDRFTIVGLWGNYILKPPTKKYPELPELEDLTMHLSKISGIEVVPHSLIRLKSGNLAYITKRIDRKGEEKIHMEDMCQLTEKLTEHKYNGSYEQIAKTIEKYSSAPGLDVVNFYEQVLFCFLTGNTDMHLKNFSLIKKSALGYTLSPAYDMLSTVLVIPEDTEELALNLCGKKRKLKKKHFIEAMERSGIGSKTIEKSFSKFTKTIPLWTDFIGDSFLSTALKEKYIELVINKAKQLDLI